MNSCCYSLPNTHFCLPSCLHWMARPHPHRHPPSCFLSKCFLSPLCSPAPKGSFSLPLGPPPSQTKSQGSRRPEYASKRLRCAYWARIHTRKTEPLPLPLPLPLPQGPQPGKKGGGTEERLCATCLWTAPCSRHLGAQDREGGHGHLE